MKYQIDQSGKIEQTERNTVIALVNGDKATILLKKSEKRNIQRVFKTAKMQRIFPYLTFSALVALLFYKISPRHKVIIDREYVGYEKLMEEKIETHLKQLGRNTPRFEFGHVGKLSKAHNLGYKVYIGKERATMISTAGEILRLILGTKKSV